MDLTLQAPGDHLYIRSVSEAGIQVVDTLYTAPIILSASELISDWPVRSIGQIAEPNLQAVFDLEPEVVLLGGGKRQLFLPPELMMVFYRRNMGVEVMTTDAACRTFNVLVSENRNVVAALIPF